MVDGRWFQEEKYPRNNQNRSTGDLPTIALEELHTQYRLMMCSLERTHYSDPTPAIVSPIQTPGKSEPLVPSGDGVIRSRPESIGDVQSRSESFGVVRSRSESAEVNRSRPVQYACDKAFGKDCATVVEGFPSCSGTTRLCACVAKGEICCLVCAIALCKTIPP